MVELAGAPLAGPPASPQEGLAAALLARPTALPLAGLGAARLGPQAAELAARRARRVGL